MLIKNIDEEIEKLLKIKEIVDEVATLRASNNKLQVVSQFRYDYLASNNLIKPTDCYYIADLSVKPYIEGFQG
jgi:hypothetical protein